jgi:hypothetical protein
MDKESFLKQDKVYRGTKEGFNLALTSKDHFWFESNYALEDF